MTKTATIPSTVDPADYTTWGAEQLRAPGNDVPDTKQDILDALRRITNHTHGWRQGSGHLDWTIIALMPIEPLRALYRADRATAWTKQLDTLANHKVTTDERRAAKTLDKEAILNGDAPTHVAELYAQADKYRAAAKDAAEDEHETISRARQALYHTGYDERDALTRRLVTDDATAILEAYALIDQLRPRVIATINQVRNQWQSIATGQPSMQRDQINPALTVPCPDLRAGRDIAEITLDSLAVLAAQDEQTFGQYAAA